MPFHRAEVAQHGAVALVAKLSPNVDFPGYLGAQAEVAKRVGEVLLVSKLETLLHGAGAGVATDLLPLPAAANAQEGPNFPAPGVGLVFRHAQFLEHDVSLLVVV